MENIGKEIRDLIAKWGVSVRRVALDLGVAPESLYRSLADGANPEWKTIRALLDYLGYDLKMIKRKEVKKGKPIVSKSKKRR